MSSIPSTWRRNTSGTYKQSLCHVLVDFKVTYDSFDKYYSGTLFFQFYDFSEKKNQSASSSCVCLQKHCYHPRISRLRLKWQPWEILFFSMKNEKNANLRNGLDLWVLFWIYLRWRRRWFHEMRWVFKFCSRKMFKTKNSRFDLFFEFLLFRIGFLNILFQMIPGDLRGDIFFKFTCSSCTNDEDNEQEIFVRNKMLWWVV